MEILTTGGHEEGSLLVILGVEVLKLLILIMFQKNDYFDNYSFEIQDNETINISQIANY
jgi:hypothetical protein